MKKFLRFYVVPAAAAIITVLMESPIGAAGIGEKTSVDGQIRLRLELDDKSFAPNTDANDFTLMRTRLGLKVNPAEKVTVVLQFQDSRTFGTELSTLADMGNLDLHQGYVRLDDFLGAEGLTFQVGRQEISFGGERLIGPVGWHNVGRSFDGGRLYLTRPAIRAEFWAAKTNELYDNTPAENRDKNIFGFDLELVRLPEFAPRGYYIGEIDNDRSSAGLRKLSRHTLGVQATGKAGRLDYDLETALQTGELGGRDISAYLAALALGCTFKPETGTRLSAGYDYLSGNDGSADYKAFNTLYATNHKFYGSMDYFINIPAATGGLGLKDFMVKFQHKFHPQVTCKADFHLFRYAREDSFGQKALGKELDLSLLYNCRKLVKNTIGLSIFIPDEVFERTRGDRTAYWMYYMMTVDF